MAPTKSPIFEADSYRSVSTLKVNDLFLKDGHIVRLVSKDKSSPGKHGSAKYHVFVKDVFTGKKTDELFIGKALVGVPAVDRSDLMVVSYDDDDYVTVFHNGNSRADVPLDRESDLGKRVERLLAEGDTVYLTCVCFGDAVPLPQAAKAEAKEEA